MLDILDNYLADTASPDQLILVRNACAIFEEVNDNEYEGKYEEFLMIDDNADAGVTLEAIMDFTRTRLVALLMRFGVTVSEDTRTSTLIEFMRALLLLPDNENRNSIIQIVNQDRSDLEKLAELIELQTTYSADQALLDLQTVNKNLLTNLVMELSSHPDAYSFPDANELGAKKDRKTQYQDFVKACEVHQLRLATLLSRGLDANYPVNVYLTMLSQEFDEISATDIATEMVASAYLSSDAHANPLNVLRERINYYVTDIDKVTKVDIELRRLIQTFSGKI